ncbi:sigma-54 dependent transcriptional regulator [Kaistella sp. BT6-1-3]|jgi:DNA-binding NtrC family response regulator|uniref:Sigma-54 dependent transcriptional regulator n=1 Tax=Kaistella yananensis TaxID=2989820 RepID=A0ABT3JPQ0_9FLAO|nr:sigma-54 dependent transcriptional regulator [Kaistella yananensis]MCW4452753.1 sigma-54 dependent transcriptional regulator [Kaistella yananensis]
MRKKEATILIVDDDEDILFSARVWLKKFFEEVITINSPKKIIPTLNENNVDVILLDMNFRRGFEDGKEGLYWLKEIQEINKNIPVILMTAYGEVELAVEALKKGATDFILKPWNNEKLYASVNLAVDISRKNKKLQQWENLQTSLTEYNLETKSPKMQDVMKTLKKVSPTDANILLLGENGTGKFVLAEYIHKNSKRNNEPFVHIDLGSLSENLFEAELFGYAKGAFTDAKNDKAGKIENANGGTVFLDEIGNLSPQLQQKILTLIQTKKLTRIGENKERFLDIRFIFATNADLKKLFNEGKFREDLYYRINTVEIEIPPLRERKEDLQNLSEFFIQKYQKKYAKDNLEFENFEELNNYHFPGNIRELEHSIERAIILSEDGKINLALQNNPISASENLTSLNLEEMEEKMIANALKKYKGNISLASEALGLTRASLYRRMEKFGL